MPYERPELPWDATTALAEDQRSLAMVCELSEPAPGLIAWLTVRHHRASTGQHWRDGVFLRHPIELYASEALLELEDDRHLGVEVRAPSPDLFFNVLRDSIEDLITRRWPGLRYQLHIPCPSRLPDQTACPGQFKLEGLLRLRERGKLSITCQECTEDHDVAELLTGYALPPLPLKPELDRMQDQLVEVARGVKRLEEQAAETAQRVRQVLTAVGREVTDCPRLFVLTPEEPVGWRRLRVWEKGQQLTLWCEHPGHWHSWPTATYQLKAPPEWLRQISPYATLVVKTLRLAVPLAGAVAGVVWNEDQLKQTEHELELMKTIVEHLPEQLGDNLPTLQPASELTPAEGAGLRALRALLFQVDAAQAFGGLSRVQGPAGDFLWVCSDHYAEYDPGLPALPGS